MPFKRYVEIGRVAMINYGEEYGKLVVITDIIDQNRALCDHPDEKRRVISFKRLAVTDYKVEVPRLAAKKVLAKAFKESDVAGKFSSSAWGQKISKQKSKAGMTDFDRYKAMVEKSKKARVVRKIVNQLKKSK